MLRWTFCVIRCYLFCILSFILTTAGQRASTLYAVASGCPAAAGIQFFSSPLPFGWGCKSNALFPISKLRRNFFFFPPRLLESAPLLAFPPYLCPSLFLQSGCKSMRLPNTIQIYAEVFFYQIAYRCNSSLVFSLMACEKKFFRRDK